VKRDALFLGARRVVRAASAPRNVRDALFLGVDGCRAGWVACEWRRPPRLYATFRDIVRENPRATIAIDIPIGLDAGDRECDKLARAQLGPRRSSVFPPPPRAALRATKRPATMGAQAWAIVPKIREVDGAMTPALQKRVRESHPELVFAALAGAPMKHPKRTPTGARERLRALGWRAMPVVPVGGKLDDVLDAYALSLEARRIALGVATRYPLRPKKDARGLRMEIWG
jgi:predicted RNase H-like nuclease